MQGTDPAVNPQAAVVVPAPSQDWETMPLPDFPQTGVQVWFQPAHLPQGLLMVIPDETWQSYPHQTHPLTMRKLLHAVGVDPAYVATWQLYGGPWYGVDGTDPVLDQPIPVPAAGFDPTITVTIGVPAVADAPVAPETVTSENVEEIFEHIEVNWHGAKDIQKELGRLRKRLLDMRGRLKTLNRDLTPQERVHGSNLDKKDWQAARRGMRECATRIARLIKALDIGDTSAAGQRNHFNGLYEESVVPRKQFEGMLQAQRDFAQYRKSLLALQTSMVTAYAYAEQNGERRAQPILARIAVKVREAGTRKNMLGVMFD